MSRWDAHPWWIQCQVHMVEIWNWNLAGRFPCAHFFTTSILYLESRPTLSLHHSSGIRKAGDGTRCSDMASHAAVSIMNHRWSRRFRRLNMLLQGAVLNFFFGLNHNVDIHGVFTAVFIRVPCYFSVPVGYHSHSWLKPSCGRQDMVYEWSVSHPRSVVFPCQQWLQWCVCCSRGSAMKRNLHPFYFLLLFMACHTRPVSDFIRKSSKNLFRVYVLVKC